MRRWVKRHIVLEVGLLIAFVLIYWLFFYSVSFDSLLPVAKQEQVVSIQVRDGGNGQYYRTTDRRQIEGFLDILRGHRYRKAIYTPTVDGYAFGGELRLSDGTAVPISLSRTLQVNRVKYMVVGKPLDELLPYIQQKFMKVAE
ncbi:hypothetical protein [Gorillibacterium sp. sgz500922]|uniref:hypothetical protein n=1 Tax=Gorillibacterium sp. sgz500922 TaxID=3446694 RepID=UPI003F677CC0